MLGLRLHKRGCQKSLCLCLWGESEIVYTGILDIIESLKINIKMEEILLNGNTLRPETRSTTADNDSALFRDNNLKSEQVTYK